MSELPITKSNPRLSLDDLRDKSIVIRGKPDLIDLVKKAKSPTQAFSRCMRSNSSQKLARACRFARIIMRDYGEAAFSQVFCG